jgi:hypothetical protein
MAEGLSEIESINWRRTFSFLEILRSFRMAIHPAKLILCLLGLAASVGIATLLDQLPGVGETKLNGNSFWQNFMGVVTGPIWGRWPTTVEAISTDSILALLLSPVAAAGRLVGLAVDYWREGPLFSLVNTVFSLSIWAVIGGAVTRMAAVRFAREESVSLKKALCFSLRKWPSLVTSPLIPFGVMVLMVIFVGLLTGLPLMIPYAGEVLLGLFWWLAEIAFFMASLVFVAALFNLGLQWPTIAAEGSDSFDAISRSVSYISSRPWRYLFYTAFATVYGCATFIFVKLIAYLTLAIGHFSTQFFTWDDGTGTNKLERLWGAPALNDPWPKSGHEVFILNGDMIRAEPFAHWLMVFWIFILLGLAVAFLVSFFFTSQTVIYFLLRRTVDATDVEEVYLEESEEESLPIEHKVEAPEPPPAEPPAKPSGEAPPPEKT